MSNVSYRVVLAAVGCMGRYQYMDFDDLPNENDLDYAEDHYSNIIDGIRYVVLNVFPFSKEDK